MKTTIRHKLCALALSLSIPACGLESSGPDSSDELELVDRGGDLYSGEDLFLGIFFGQGEVATRMPLTWGDCSAETRQRAIASMKPDLLLSEVERMLRNPANEAFFPHLEAARDALASGEVQHTDERVYGVIVELVREHHPEFFEHLADAVRSGDHNEIADAIRRGREIIRDIILVNQNPFDPGEGQGIVEVAVVIVAVAAWVIVWLEVLVVGGSLDRSEIFEEIMVDEIATQLAVY